MLLIRSADVVSAPLIAAATPSRRRANNILPESGAIHGPT
jgi:hypothetical protein